MVLGSHVIFCAYGFWLPNDPRGSWSDFVASWELYRAGGPAERPWDRVSHAREPHDHEARITAKQALKRPPVSFTGIQARGIGMGFAKVVRRHDIVVCACSILPEHVHLVIQRHEMPVERIWTLLKASATCDLLREKLHPFQTPCDSGPVPHMWAEGGWKVFLDSSYDLERAIEYVEENPCKEGKPRQHWSFVQPYQW